MVSWRKYNKDNTKELSFEGQSFDAKVVDVYDGDTVKVVFPIKYKIKGFTVLNQMYKWNCRLIGVDTPEIRTRNKLEKVHGYFVRDKLKEKILNKKCNIMCGKFDKYGRLLIDITIDKCNVNNWLIENDYAFEYDGGTKRSWETYLEAKKTKQNTKIPIDPSTLKISI